MEECIICFEIIDPNEHVIMECCKQNVHKSCLELWLKTNINKITDISFCFYCKQKNNNIDYIIEIINDSNSNIIETSSNITETSSNTYRNDINIVELNSNIILFNLIFNYRVKIIIIIIIFIIVLYLFNRLIMFIVG